MTGALCWWFVFFVALGGTLDPVAESDDAGDEFPEDATLDLSVASLDEIASLPGVDLRLAEAIVALRESGELRTLDDLLLVPDLGRERLAAIREHVILRRPRTAHLFATSWLESGIHREGTMRHLVDVGSGSLRGLFRAFPERGELRATGIVSGERVGLMVGALRPRLAAGLLMSGGYGRGRSAAAPWPRTATFRPRSGGGSDRGFEGAAAQLRVGSVGVAAFGGRGPEATPEFALAFSHHGRWVSALESHWAPKPTLGLWFAGGATAGEWVVQGAMSARGSVFRASVRGRAGVWRGGVDLSATGRGLAGALDPVSGSLLKRSQHTLQAWGSWARSGVAVHALLRRMELDADEGGGATRHRARVEFRARRRSERGISHEIRAGMGVDVEGDSDRVQGALRILREGVGVWTRLGWSWRGLAARERSVFACEHVRGGRWQWRSAVATAFGRSPSPWANVRPTVGIRTLWLPQGTVAVWQGLELATRRFAIGGWTWSVTDGSRLVDHGAGITVGLRTGAMVRRLLR